MNAIVSAVLRCGVILSASVITFGGVLFAAQSWSAQSAPLLAYASRTVPSLSSVFGGLATLSPYSVIELGVILLLATPVARVLCSVLLFATERDRIYVLVTLAVLLLLMFSMLVTPFIPLFRG